MSKYQILFMFMAAFIGAFLGIVGIAACVHKDVNFPVLHLFVVYVGLNFVLVGIIVNYLIGD